MKKTISLISALIIFSSLASAGFGISFPGKIPLHPGETYEGNINLQNVLQSAEDMTLEIVIQQGQEYVEFPNGNQVQINAGEIKDIPIKITIPEKSNDESYKVKLLFQPVSQSSQQPGSVNIVLALGKSFDIEVLKENNSQIIALISLILLAIIAAILIWFLIRTIRRGK